MNEVVQESLEGHTIPALYYSGGSTGLVYYLYDYTMAVKCLKINNLVHSHFMLLFMVYIIYYVTNQPNCHILYFKKYRYEIFKQL